MSPSSTLIDLFTEYVGFGAIFESVDRYYYSADPDALKVGLYKLNPVDPQLETAWFQPLSLLSENLISKFAFKFSSYRYIKGPAALSARSPPLPHSDRRHVQMLDIPPAGTLYKSNSIETLSLKAPGFIQHVMLKCDFPWFSKSLRSNFNLYRYTPSAEYVYVRLADADGTPLSTVGTITIESGNFLLASVGGGDSKNVRVRTLWWGSVQVDR